MPISTKPFTNPFGRPFLNPFGDQDAVFSPDQISNLISWHESGQGITLNGSDVADWADLSGNGFDFSQPTASAQPAYSAGVPEIVFDGVDEFLVGDDYSPTISQPITIFITARVNSSAGFKSVFDNTNGAAVFQLFFDSNDDIKVNAGIEIADLAQAQGNNVMYSIEFNTTTTVRVGGVLDIAADAGSNAPDGLFLGQDRFSGSFLGGAIRSVIVYDKALSNAELNQVGNYLADLDSVSWTNI